MIYKQYLRFKHTVVSGKYHRCRLKRVDFCFETKYLSGYLVQELHHRDIRDLGNETNRMQNPIILRNIVVVSVSNVMYILYFGILNVFTLIFYWIYILKRKVHIKFTTYTMNIAKQDLVN